MRAPVSFRFDRFSLDHANRRLLRDGTPIDLSARYLDALALLVREQGALISKERFLEEVWRGAPVTDEALTQCIKTLRRQLGDDAASPRFIETVPKHGYRFIAPVTTEPGPAAASWAPLLRQGVAGMLGGAAAGVLGGGLYRLIAVAPGMGAASALIVLVCVSGLIGLLGGAGVGIGIAAAGLARGNTALWTIAGGALGGLVVGGVVKLIGLDAFHVLFGRAPDAITGGAEGALLGAR